MAAVLIIKVAAICYRKASTNLGLIRAATELCKESVRGMQIENQRKREEGTTPFVMRPRITFNLKGVQYELMQETVLDKSELLLKSNLVYKKQPVLIHEGTLINEYMIQVQYIDETWKDGPADDTVLIGLLNYQDDKAGIILKYMYDESRLLKAYDELPENTRLNKGIAGGMEEDDEGVADDYV